MDKISYALGLSIGNNFKSGGVKNLNLPDFSKAIEDVFNDVAPAMGYEEAQQVINDYFLELQKGKTELNKTAGEEFLRINKNKAGVNTLPSGLQYEVLKQGDGAKPKATDQVKCHYEGRLIDGRVFDSSIQRGQPATFGLNQVIKGWTEALQLMPVGSKWRLFLPPELAYGPQQAGELIEPNSTLVFDVELLDIV
jgi:FKBP-type peptidyl-prolyl cis-trans isomerases 1